MKWRSRQCPLLSLNSRTRFSDFDAAEEFARVDAGAGLDDLPLAVHVEADGGEVFLTPLIGGNHGEHLASADIVEVIDAADDGLELDFSLVNELVPVEVVDGGEVGLSDFLELLLKVALDLGNAPGFEGGKVVRNDRGAKRRYGIRQKCP